jgi:DNA replication protein DnaC
MIENQLKRYLQNLQSKGFERKVLDGLQLQEAKQAVEGIARTMCNQSFDFDKDNQEAYDLLTRWFMCFEGIDLERGLLISGGVGSGKTLALRVMLELVNMLGVPDLKGFKIYHAKEIESEFSVRGLEFLREFRQNKVIAIDDIGDEKLKAKYYADEENVIRVIISDRYNLYQRLGTPTFYTTNYNLEDLGKMYGTRVGDRLKELNKIVFRGKSRRK